MVGKEAHPIYLLLLVIYCCARRKSRVLQFSRSVLLHCNFSEAEYVNSGQ